MEMGNQDAEKACVTGQLTCTPIKPLSLVEAHRDSDVCLETRATAVSPLCFENSDVGNASQAHGCDQQCPCTPRAGEVPRTGLMAG
ncbi:hypothetical protein P7K49_014852 [Saguinus oedipus]|uniref:Uncharacterized protein n=1 Tax=Saguinus oedipus TaxID=9490 RepID=A0ABQ9V9H8_SAGOE|nr:hypothetical protein P7K49_014852 [Saguinus oedipus]